MRSATPTTLVRAPVRALVVLAATLAVVAGVLSTPGTSGAARYKVDSVQVAPGVTLLRVTDSQGPNRIRILKVNPQVATLDAVTAGSTFPAYATTSSIAKANHAVAAINGDFALSGHPWHPFLEDGIPATTGLNVGSGFSTTAGGGRSFVGRGPINSVAENLGTGGTKIDVGAWNFDVRKSGVLGVYTKKGGSAERPPQDACYARLAPAGDLAWFDGKTEIRRRYDVGQRGCQSSPIGIGKNRKAVVIASKGRKGGAAAWIRHLGAGDDVLLRWWINDRPNVLDQQSGIPLLEAGKIVAPASCGSYFCGRNPRTGIGYKADGTVLLITVDGRQSSSKGMNLPDFARVFLWQGANWAVNLDGGGSTTMAARVGGSMKVVNRPANPGGAQRRICSAYVVLTHGDPGEPNSLTGGTGRIPASAAGATPARDAAAGPRASAEAEAAALADPGSTGGLLDLLEG